MNTPTMTETERNVALLAKDSDFASFILAIFLYKSLSIEEGCYVTKLQEIKVIQLAKRAYGEGLIMLLSTRNEQSANKSMFTHCSRFVLTNKGNEFKQFLTN